MRPSACWVTCGRVRSKGLRHTHSSSATLETKTDSIHPTIATTLSFSLFTHTRSLSPARPNLTAIGIDPLALLVTITLTLFPHPPIPIPARPNLVQRPPQQDLSVPLLLAVSEPFRETQRAKPQLTWFRSPVISNSLAVNHAPSLPLFPCHSLCFGLNSFPSCQL